MSRFLAGLIALVAATLGFDGHLAAQGEIPGDLAGFHVLPYDGYLEMNGVPVDAPDGLSIMFAVTPDPTCLFVLCEVYREVRTVPVVAGRFRVLLGSAGAALATGNLEAAITDGEDLYVSMFGAAGELQPRQRVLPVPWALVGAESDEFTVGGTASVAGNASIDGTLRTRDVLVAGSLSVSGRPIMADAIDNRAEYELNAPLFSPATSTLNLGTTTQRFCALSGMRYASGDGNEGFGCAVTIDGSNYVLTASRISAFDVTGTCWASCFYWD